MYEQTKTTSFPWWQTSAPDGIKKRYNNEGEQMADIKWIKLNIDMFDIRKFVGR